MKESSSYRVGSHFAFNNYMEKYIQYLHLTNSSHSALISVMPSPGGESSSSDPKWSFKSPLPPSFFPSLRSYLA